MAPLSPAYKQLTSVVLPASKADASALVRGVEEAGIPIEIFTRRLTEYSYDASNYRIPPLALVFPRSVDDVVAVMAACRETGTPLISRGGGTSMAGNAVGPGIVLDFSRHMNKILGIDETSGTADVEAGAMLSTLTREAERSTDGNLTFAPDPSSKTRATIGRAIGNDACGNQLSTLRTDVRSRRRDRRRHLGRGEAHSVTPRRMRH